MRECVVFLWCRFLFSDKDVDVQLLLFESFGGFAECGSYGTDHQHNALHMKAIPRQRLWGLHDPYVKGGGARPRS